VTSIDLKKRYHEHYTARVGQPALVEVPPRPFIMIDGAGDPNSSQEYADAVAALYPIAYGIRAVIKRQSGDGYTVMPLEGLWWADDMAQFSIDRKGDWKWTMMICQPDVVTPELAAALIPEITAKKGLAGGDRARFEVYAEGRAAQVMHLGPYADEAPTIALLHRFIADQGLQLSGLHHEIYLGDPRKTDPAKLKTIIRQPVTPA
jgi:hypothetical protein